MTKQTEALKLAFKQAFDLGQTYWSWADSEYQSHWKKADAAKERFNQLVEDTIREILSEPQTDWEAVAADQAMTIALLKAEQPAQQEPVAWIEHYQGGISYSLYREAAKQLPDDIRFDLYTAPPQRKPLTDEEITEIAATPAAIPGSYVHSFARAIEAAHGIKGDA